MTFTIVLCGGDAHLRISRAACSIGLNSHRDQTSFVCKKKGAKYFWSGSTLHRRTASTHVHYEQSRLCQLCQRHDLCTIESKRSKFLLYDNSFVTYSDSERRTSSVLDVTAHGYDENARCHGDFAECSEAVRTLADLHAPPQMTVQSTAKWQMTPSMPKL